MDKRELIICQNSFNPIWPAIVQYRNWELQSRLTGVKNGILSNWALRKLLWAIGKTCGKISGFVIEFKYV